VAVRLAARGRSWTISPAFDLNPDPRPGPRQLSTAIDFDDNSARLDTLLDVADVFRLTQADAEQVLREVAAATGTWRIVARATGIPEAGIEEMKPAFEHDEATAARSL
jgi:serine/threonine-protein kinase HipA